ncbi:MAG: hypothetical protein F4029_13400 [Gammaproteobacteria bacterium]|nr:hypothetical protein [Gammaproteobacteria bacterium]MXY54946.1 hypothetical protein [Gammaproteobacteria bacterium]MYK47212.1 hypothetical protein [Gammaproteobacteria bacterium]
MTEKPAALRPVTVAKPWGHEVWYSGVEARGESGVVTDNGIVSLSSYIDARHRATPVILLKALQSTAGNLYLEVHETKSEVYVVDRIHGTGRMLLGARPDVLARMGDAGFRAAVRQVAGQAEAGQADIEAVQAFMNPVDLRPGDAVTIPSRVPHSLLKGMHVIEFQTPVFERKILAASQPVVTQQGWDIDSAVAAMDLSVQPGVERPGGHEVQVIARAPDFVVTRHRPPPHDAFPVSAWAVGWVVRGTVRCRDRRFPARTAFVAPTAAELDADADTEVLVATEA